MGAKETWQKGLQKVVQMEGKGEGDILGKWVVRRGRGKGSLSERRE